MGTTAIAPTPEADAAGMAQRAARAAALLKALAHEGRMMILCHLADGEKTVTELEALLGSRQAAVSQHLARLPGVAQMHSSFALRTVLRKTALPV